MAGVGEGVGIGKNRIYRIQIGTEGRRSVWIANSATGGRTRGNIAENSKVGYRGSGLYGKRPNGPRSCSRVGKTDQVGTEREPYSLEPKRRNAGE